MNRRWRRSAAVMAALVADAAVAVLVGVVDGVDADAHAVRTAAASVIATRRLYANFIIRTPDIAGKSWCSSDNPKDRLVLIFMRDDRVSMALGAGRDGRHGDSTLH